MIIGLASSLAQRLVRLSDSKEGGSGVTVLVLRRCEVKERLKAQR